MTLPERYLELVKRSLLNELYPELEAILHYFVLCRRDGQDIDPAVVRDIARARPDLIAGIRAARAEGALILWPPAAGGREAFDPRNLTEHVHTMIGRKRLDHLHRCLDAIL
ncbi:MAG: macrocin O-methyltransferase, partial [Alphaproteobacteria bacterium]|nr:macrocin O-methyltransferase [Alphaproteobacteria bacterium]